nr:hypothetical protein [Chroococcidiopsis sp. SAG 2025]
MSTTIETQLVDFLQQQIGISAASTLASTGSISSDTFVTNRPVAREFVEFRTTRASIRLVVNSRSFNYYKRSRKTNNSKN